MATIVNNPGNSDSGGSGMFFLIGIIVLVLAGFFFLFYGLPMIRNSMGGVTGNGGTTIQVPDKVDVNVNPGQ